MANPFLEVRFPPHISRGAIGGCRWPVRRVRVDSGFVFRYPRADQPEGSWEVSHALLQSEDFEEVREFFMCVGGGEYGFRFKDWSDYIVRAERSSFIAIDSTHSQLAKRYQVLDIYGTPVTRDRMLQKIVPGTFVPTGGTGLDLDYDTGILEHATDDPPDSYTTQFDCPCILGSDEMRGRIVEIENGTGDLLQGWSDIPIELIRV